MEALGIGSRHVEPGDAMGPVGVAGGEGTRKVGRVVPLHEEGEPAVLGGGLEPRGAPVKRSAVGPHPRAPLGNQPERARDLLDPIGAEGPANGAVSIGDAIQEGATVPVRARERFVHHAEQLEVLAAQRDDAIGGAQTRMHAAVLHREPLGLHATRGRLEVPHPEHDLAQLEHAPQPR
jgi:hypothetical protein